MSITALATPQQGIVEWAAFGRPIAGESVSGDMHLVAHFPGGVLAAVIDGLGHGPEAAIAARAAVRILTRHAGEPVTDLVLRCHEELRPTRGAVLSLVSIDVRQSALSWIGIGNVETLLFRAVSQPKSRRESLISRSGVVGYELTTPHVRTLSIEPGDTIIFATDGIGSEFTSVRPEGRDAATIAAEIIDSHAKVTDDSLALVVRYLGADLS